MEPGQEEDRSSRRFGRSVLEPLACFSRRLGGSQEQDPVARESSRLSCAAVTGAQTTLDPKQMKEWTPNSKYGAHAFGLRNFSNSSPRGIRSCPGSKNTRPMPT